MSERRLTIYASLVSLLMQIKKKKQMIGNRACLPEIVYLCDKLRPRRKTPHFFMCVR